TEDRKVVGCEIPDDTHVGLVQPEVDSAERKEVDLPELARIEHLLDLDDGRAVHKRMSGEQDERRVFGTTDQLLRLRGRRRERLLDQDMLAGLECGARKIEVRR